jgi:hypothetical protein
MSIISVISREMASDDYDESDKLEAYYFSLKPKEKKIVDEVMMFLCGWTFESIRKANKGGG